MRTTVVEPVPSTFGLFSSTVGALYCGVGGSDTAAPCALMGSGVGSCTRGSGAGESGRFVTVTLAVCATSDDFSGLVEEEYDPERTSIAMMIMPTAAR